MMCFMVLSCYECVLDLSYTSQEAAILIETLSVHWDKVLDHLNRVSRLPSYRFHMREVRMKFLSFIYFPQRHRPNHKIGFEPNILDECFRLDTAYLARLFIIRCVLDHC